MKTLILSSGDEMYINSGSTDLLMYIPASTAAREKKITEIIKSNGLSSFIIDTISYKNHSIAGIKKANVLPDPVFAAPRISFPANAKGNDLSMPDRFQSRQYASIACWCVHFNSLL